MPTISILWKRLDAPGHDAASMLEDVGESRIHGASVFSGGGQATWLSYSLILDSHWRAMRGAISGGSGPDLVDVHIERSSEGVWSFNGSVVSGLDDCLDLDYGFTPATNLSQIRRASLRRGQTAEFRVAWFDLSIATIRPLLQRYERRSASTYWYESPEFGYSGLLEFDEAGFCHSYPGLWQVAS